MIMALTDFVVGVGAPVIPSAAAPTAAPVVVIVGGGGVVGMGAPVVHVVGLSWVMDGVVMGLTTKSVTNFLDIYPYTKCNT